MWAALIEAAKAALFEKVKEMTKEEAKKLLDKLGVRVSEVTDEIVANAQAYKDERDAETRRKTRLCWGIVAVVCSVVSFCAGHYI